MTGLATRRARVFAALSLAGGERLGRGLGTAGAFLLALLWSRVHVPRALDRWLVEHPPRPSPELVWDPPPSLQEITFGKTQPRAFSMVLGAVLVAVALAAGVDLALSRYRVTRPVAWIVRGLLVVTALTAAGRTSPFVGLACLGMILPAGLLFAAQTRDARPWRADRTSPGAAIVLVAEALSLGWGVWLTFWEPLNALSILVVMALSIAASAHAARRLAHADDARLGREAIAFAPLLALPLLGILREPSPAWLLVVCAACALFARATRARAADRWTAPLLRGLCGVGAPWALVTMLVLPMRFRDLPTINLFDHEAIHLGWVNSISFGKLMMADAGFVYGPVREYLIAALSSLLGGLTLEHVRESHIVLNLIGVALTLQVGWRVARRRPWLQLWWTWLLLTETQFALLAKYHDFISFGWLDGVRPAIALVALTGAVDTTTAAPRARGADGTFAACRALFLWGFLCGVAVLYSQDFGPCAFGGVGLAIGADCLLRTNGGPRVDRVLRLARLAGAWTAGALLPVLAFVLVYACFGKAGLLIQRVTTWTGFLVSGAWSGHRYPLEPDTYLTWRAIASHDERGILAIDYGVPLLSVLLSASLIGVALVRRAWTARTTLYLALCAFAFTSFRHALIHSDVWHLRSDGTGAILLLFAIFCDLASLKLRIGARARAVPIGAVTVALLAVGWTNMEQSWDPLRWKLRALAMGDETPSQGKPFDNPGIPRAGDVHVPEDVKALVKYVSETTTRNDPVLCTTGFMTGGDLAFVIDRKNPIPFDVAHELTTRGDQAEVLRDLEDTPPALIIGDYLPLLGLPARRFIEANWTRVSVPGFSGVVRRYRGAGEPGPTPVR